MDKVPQESIMSDCEPLEHVCLRALRWGDWWASLDEEVGVIVQWLEFHGRRRISSTR